MLIDCFLMNNELDMLEFRLTEHDPFTDLFVIIESLKHLVERKRSYLLQTIKKDSKNGNIKCI